MLHHAQVLVRIGQVTNGEVYQSIIILFKGLTDVKLKIPVIMSISFMSILGIPFQTKVIP